MLDASAADPDGDALTYAWTASAGWTVSGSGAQVTLQAPATAGATGTVTLKVTDVTGAQAVASVVVSTRQNNAPALASITATPSVVARGGTVALAASASDADGDALTYAWTFPAGWSGTPSGATASLVAPATPGELAAVQLTVTDTSGASVTGSLVVSTRANAAPVLSSVTANPPSVQKGGDVVVTAFATDAEGDALTYAWTAPADWTLAGNGAQVTLTAPATPGASGTLAVTVTDAFGATASSSVLLSTLPNQRPTVSSIAASPGTVQKGGSSTVSVSASDADGDALMYTWASSNPAWTVVGSGASVAVTAPGTPGSSTTLSVTVSDDSGGSTTASAVVSTYNNVAPTLASLNGTPNPVFRGGTITLLASASDGDGDTLTYSWAVNDGAWTLTPSGATATLVAPNAYAKSATVTLTVTDGLGGSVQGSFPVGTAPNRAPSIQSLSSSTLPVLPGASATVVVSAVDADGDTLGYTWSAGAGWTITGTGTSILVKAPHTDNQQTTLTVSVDDGFGGLTQGTLVLNSSACAALRKNCDGDPANACESNVAYDANNCGGCGVVCGGATPYCGNGTCTSLWWASGVQKNIPEAQVSGGGWQLCYSDDFGNSSTSLNTIKTNCSKANLLIACRPTGSPNLQLAAMAPRADVLYESGSGSCSYSTPHVANGVGFYYSDSWSWGFVRGGDTAYRCSCDTDGSGDPSMRMCWHTGGGNINNGYRCGNDYPWSSNFERLVYQAD